MSKIGESERERDRQTERKRSYMAFMFDLKTWFKFTAYPFQTSTIFVKYRLERTKGREHMVHNPNPYL